MNQLINGIHALNEGVGKIVSWLTFLLVILVCFDVTVRYLLNETQAWIMELEWHLFAAIFLLGAGYTLRHDRHVRVDLFYSNFAPKDKALVNFIGALVFLIPWCLLLLFVSFKYAYGSWLIQEGSPDPGGLPARYLIKFCIVLGIFFLLLQAIAQLLENWQILRGLREPEKEQDHPRINEII